MIAALQKLDSNSMYWVLNSLNHAASDAKQTAIAETNQEWRQAAAEKRIKTRKQRNGNGVKVWIELTPA